MAVLATQNCLPKGWIYSAILQYCKYTWSVKVEQIITFLQERMVACTACNSSNGRLENELTSQTIICFLEWMVVQFVILPMGSQNMGLYRNNHGTVCNSTNERLEHGLLPQTITCVHNVHNSMVVQSVIFLLM